MLVLVPVTGEAAGEKQPLPTVLLLGDSISVGYAPHVKRRLAGVAVVKFAERENGRPRNLGNTRGALKSLRSGRVPSGHFDLIHFNFGQNDFAYRNKAIPPGAPGRMDKIKGKITTPIEDYERNLRQIISALEPRAGTLLWASSTIIPEDEPARVPGDEVRYNAVADRVMREAGIPTHDLYELTTTFDAAMFVAPGDVHYGPSGSARLAEQIAEEIRKRLPANRTADASQAAATLR